MEINLVSVTLVLPLLGLIPVVFADGKDRDDIVRWGAFIASLVTFLVALGLLFGFDIGDPGLQFVETFDWIPGLGISYYVGVDGLSILLVLLTAFIMPLAILSSFSAITERIKLYYAFMLILETAMLGVFVAQDLFLFYIFWEVTLVPMYFLIGIWGAENRLYAAIKFFLYTMAGSILMLLAILWLGINGGTFALPELIDQGIDYSMFGSATEALLFFAFAIAFAIKVPLWPLHSWLPDAHVQAPTAGSVILAGILLKMGTYGFVRFNLPLFPEASRQYAPLIATLAVIGIIYAAWVSYAQKDMKKLVAYSSVSHLGFVMLGIFSLTAQGIQGGILQMINHGLSTGGLFLMVGMLYERRHTKLMSAFGGIWKAMPIYGGLSLIIVLSSMGLPGLNGFVGEFTILMGALGSNVLAIGFAAFAATGVILAAIYLLTMFQKVFMGPLEKDENKALSDINRREILVLVPIVILLFVIGLYPAPFFGLMDTAVGHLLAHIGPVLAAGR